MAHSDVSSSKTAEEGCSAVVEPGLLMPIWMSPENSAVLRPPMTGEEIASLSVVCTSCGARLNHHRKSRLRKHKLLNVIVCKRCYLYYGDGQFRQRGSDSDEYCSWCAEGGILVLCDRCGRVFCKVCIRRNFSCWELNRIESLEEWQCYVCNPTPLEPMVNYARAIINYSKQLKKQMPSSNHSKKPKLSEIDLKKLVLDKAKEIQHSLSVLARQQVGFLEEASTMLRNHADALSRIAENVETCQRRQLRSVKRAKKKEDGKHSCLEALPSVDSNAVGNTIADTMRLVAVDGAQHHTSGSDKDNWKDEQVQERSELFSQGKTNCPEVSPTTGIVDVSAIKTEISSPPVSPRSEVPDVSAIKTEVSGPGVSPTTEFPDVSAIKTEVNSAEVSLRTEISDVSEIATEVTETCMDGSSVCSIAENNNETLKILNRLPTPSSGSEFPSLAPNVKCEEVSENVVAGIMVNSSSEQHSIPSKNGNKETAVAKVKTENIEEIPSSREAYSSADTLSSSSSISDFETGRKSAAFKFEFVGEDKSESSTSSSSEESSRAASESSKTFEDCEQKKSRATRGQFHNRKNTCKRAARSAQARRPRAYTWITSDSSDLSSDTDDDYEWHKSSRSKSCARKRKAPTRRKCAPRTPPPPPLSDEVIRRYLEEAFERYQDPKLVMHMTVDIERLPDYQFSSATKRMKTESDDWSFVEGLADACNIAKTRSYDSSNDGEDQERPLEQHDGHEEFVVSPAKDPDGKGRRNIRKLISDEELAQQTKAAAQAEEERKQRIAERRKLYYEVLGAQVGDDHETVKELVLEVDLQTKEPLVQVNEKLVKLMKPHQVKGVKFIYDCVIESLEMLKKDPEKGSGCILAHCMGLGKSFQVISFLHTVMTHKEAGALLRTALVICPYNTVVNWANEFDLWLHRNGLEMKVYEVSSMKVNTVRLESLEKWQSEGGVVIIGYSMFCHLIRGSGKRKNRAMLSRYKRILLNPGPQLVICDEGHVLKNDSTGLSKALSTMKTGRRIVLTGTPLQNNLAEYHCMVSFIKPGLLGTKTEFINRFVNPIANGQCADSTVHDVKLMKKRVHVLHRLLEGFVQRCDKTALAPYLPPKHEYVIRVRLSEVQVSLYRHFLENLTEGPSDQRMNNISLFSDYFTLQNISTHPLLLELSDDRAAARDFIKDNDEEESDSAIPFIDEDISEKSTSDVTDEDVEMCSDGGEPAPPLTEGNEKDDIEEESGAVKSTSLYHTRSRGDVENRPPTPPELRKKQWWDEYISADDIEKLQISGKLTLFYDILQECDAIGDKVLLFSQSLLTLDLVERMLEQCDSQAATADTETNVTDSTNPLQDCHNTWVLGVDYFRIDGGTSVDLRSRWISMFNDESNHRGRLFLLSTRAGSLGTNLVGANRVVLMDASWNPTHDVQAIYRVYRFGQKKPVFIYRLLAQGTMEEKIYNRQVTKQALACRVVDKRQVERLFNAAELVDLYKFNPVSKDDPQPTPKVPSDRLLAELLIRNKDWIVSYHEHDSLLQNVTTEELTEEEHKLAWEEYKDEREGRLAAAVTATPTVPANAATAKPTSLRVSARRLDHHGNRAKKRRMAPKVIRVQVPVSTTTASATSMPMLVSSTMGMVTTTTTSSLNLAAQNFVGTNMTNVFMAPRAIPVGIPIQVCIPGLPATTMATSMAASTTTSNLVRISPKIVDTRTLRTYTRPRVVHMPVTMPLNSSAGVAPIQGAVQAVFAPAGVTAGVNLPLAPRRVIQVQVPAAVSTKAALSTSSVGAPAAVTATSTASTSTGSAPTSAGAISIAGTNIQQTVVQKFNDSNNTAALAASKVLQVQVPAAVNNSTGVAPIQGGVQAVFAPAGVNFPLAPRRVIQVQVPATVGTKAALSSSSVGAPAAVTATSTASTSTGSAPTSAGAISIAGTNIQQTVVQKFNDSNNTAALAASKVLQVQVPAAVNNSTAEGAPEMSPSLPKRTSAFLMIAHKFIGLDKDKAFPTQKGKAVNVVQQTPGGVASVAGAAATTIKADQYRPVYKSTATSTDLEQEAEPAPVREQEAEPAPVQEQEAEPAPVPVVLPNVAVGLSTQGSNDNFRLILDVYKMTSDIKSRAPHISNAQLVHQMKRTMLEYRLKFQGQQCQALEEICKLVSGQKPVPDELNIKLKEAKLAVDQLSIATRELEEAAKLVQKNQKLTRLVQILPLLKQRLRHMLPRQRLAKNRQAEQVQAEQIQVEQVQPQLAATSSESSAESAAVTTSS